MSVFEEIKAGLHEAIELEKGNLKAQTTTLSVTPANETAASETTEAADMCR